MAQRAYFFDATSGSPSYSAADFNRALGLFAREGVVPSHLNDLQVYGDSSGMQVKVKSGASILDPRNAQSSAGLFESDAEVVLTVASNSSGSTRTDSVVVRRTAGSKTIALAVLQGTPGAGAPALTQNSATYEQRLGNVTVANGAVTVAAGDVSDQRTYARALTADIADAAITAAKIATAAVGTAQIADTAVTNAKLASGAVTDAKVTDVASGKITGTFAPSTISPQGSGSGLDADTVDGYEGASLLARANHTGTQAPSTISPQGAASGLDADTVDGQHSSAFATAGHTHSYLTSVDGDPKVDRGLLVPGSTAASGAYTVTTGLSSVAFALACWESTTGVQTVTVYDFEVGGAGTFRIAWANNGAGAAVRILWLAFGS